MKFFLVASIACASLMSASLSHADLYSYPSHLTGTSSTLANPFVVHVTTNAGLPIQGRLIEIDFSVGPMGMKMYNSQPSGLIVNCAGERVGAYTNANGDAVFPVRFGGASDAIDRPAVKDGTTGHQGFVTACSTDIDASGSTDLGDFNYYGAVYLWNGYDPKCDFDGDGVTASDLGDYTIMSHAFLYGVTSTLCP